MVVVVVAVSVVCHADPKIKCIFIEMLKRSTFLLMWHSTVAPSTLLSSSSSSSTALLLLFLSTFTYSFALFELTCSVYVSVHMHEHFTSILHIISTAFYKYRHNVKVFSLSLSTRIASW